MMTRSDNTIWIAGAKGQLAHAIQEVAKRHPSAPRLVLSTRQTLDHTSSKEVEQFIEENQPNFLINGIAFTNVDLAESRYIEAVKANARIPYCLALAAEKAGITMLHISTDYIYGCETLHPRTPYIETDTPHPTNAYGLSKYLGEEVLRLTNACYYILRTSWLYSPMSWGHKSFYRSILQKGEAGESLSVVTDEVSTPTSVCTLAEVILQIIADYNTSHQLPLGTYHVTDEGEASRYQFAEAILKLSPKTAAMPITSITQRDLQLPAHRPNYSTLSTQKIQSYYPSLIRPWHERLQEIYQYDNK